MVFTDAQLNPKFMKPIPPVDPGIGGFGINRLTLREILLADLGPRVHFGKKLTHYEPAGDGRVIAWFADGTSAVADLLVGADGTGSTVRAQLVPDAVIDEVAWAIYGRTPITEETLSWLPDLLADTFNLVIGEGDATFSVATCRTHESPTAAAHRLAPGLSITDIPDYLQWIVPLLDEQLRAAEPAALHRLATDTVATMHPAVRRVLDQADIEATFAVRITSARRVALWADPTVTLLGERLAVERDVLRGLP
ncbi:MAG: hypothetical protein IRY85_07880 [Micromonosporaceae bacterium]|nr:hypothetical protein [Micromonosporaceae bacterium]